MYMMSHRIVFNLFLEHYIPFFFKITVGSWDLTKLLFLSNNTDICCVYDDKNLGFSEKGVNNVSRTCKLYVHTPINTRLWITNIQKNHLVCKVPFANRNSDKTACTKRRSIIHSCVVLMHMHLIIKSGSINWNFEVSTSPSQIYQNPLLIFIY